MAAKLAVLMFAAELDRRLQAGGSPVRSLAAYPGVADTPMQRQAGNPAEWLLGRALNLALGRSAAAGAHPIAVSGDSIPRARRNVLGAIPAVTRPPDPRRGAAASR